VDPWHIVELLAVAIAGGVAWYVKDLAAKVHKLDGRTSALATSQAVSDERDARFERSIVRLESAIDRFSSVLGAAKRTFSPAGGMPRVKQKPIPREDDE
jgi:hypothetical protein